MSVLNQIAYYQDRRDEMPNRELARRLVDTQDRAGIQEIADNLWNKNTNVQSDCIKVLYEIGYLDPSLVVPFAADFVRLLDSRQNRLVWGAIRDALDSHPSLVEGRRGTRATMACTS